MNLIEEYLDNIENMKLSLDDYGDKGKVRKSNKLADRNIKIVELINHQPELIMKFVSLLDSEDIEVRAWVAHHVIERMNLDKSIRLKALREIEDESINHPDSQKRLGTKMWLEQYYKANPDDKLR